jgi:aryl-phospho-beta-D-glucosidase BglC (GH1 family)
LSTSTILPSGYLSTSGNQIVDASGNDVRIASVGWNQNFTNIAANVAQMAAAGFNTIRVSWVDATLSSDLVRIQQIVAAATANGMKVILDHHTDEAGTPGDGYGAQQKNGLWYDVGPGTDGTNGAGVTGTVTQAQFLADWQTVARAFAGNSTVAGFDLDNEPLEQYGIGATPANWGGGGPTDIHAMYQTVGNAIGAIDPGALIIAEGPIEFTNLYNFDLTQAGSNPVVLNIPNKVVYSAHVYPATIGGEPVDSGAAFGANLNKSFGYLETQNIAPVWIGEIGASMDGTADSAGAGLADEQAWASTMIAYLNGKDGALGGPTFTGSQQGVSTDWWAWGNLAGQFPDGILNPDGTLNAAQKAVYSQFAPTPAVTKPVFTPSANDTVVMAGSTAAIVDASGNKWTLTSSGLVAVNGVADSATSGVKELAYVNAAVWQENSANLWWGKTAPSAAWAPGAGTSTSPLPVKPATLTLNVSEDAYQGDAQFTVKVDGTQVGGVQYASALHSSGDSNTVSLTGNWSVGAHAVQIQFINDAWGGSAATDRNLYVNSIALNGVAQSGTTASFPGSTPANFTVGGTTLPASGAADSMTLHLCEDAYNGNAQFVLSIDGKQVSTPQDVTASHSAGAWQAIAFAGSFGAGSHTVAVAFTNDLFGGTATTDRNLYVNGVDVNGQHYGTGVTSLMSASSATFNIVTAH